MNDELSLFIAKENLKKKTVEQSIAFEDDVSKKRIAILDKEYEYGKISKQKYEEAKILIDVEAKRRQAEIAVNMKKKGQKPKSESAIEKGLVDENLGTPYPGTYEQETAPIKRKGQQERVQKIAFEGKK